MSRDVSNDKENHKTVSKFALREQGCFQAKEVLSYGIDVYSARAGTFLIFSI